MRTVPVSGERKLVTALFADVVDSTSLAESMDPEDWASLMNGAFEVMSQAVERYEGTVSQLSGDALVAFFGAPVAHEDDPERAVRTGLEMVQAVELFAREVHATFGIDFAIRVGIDTGHVVAGTVGTNAHSEYTALGDAVNVAARLQAAARPGSVLIAEDTYRLVAGQFHAIELGPLPVKGKAEPVGAYEVRAVVSGSGRARGIAGLVSPMVGRTHALARLEDLYAVVAGRGWGRTAIVIGEPGIGKSRLMRELRERIADRGAWIEAHCLSYGQQLPYHLVADLVRSLAGTSSAQSEAAFAAALAGCASELLGERASAATSYIAHLLGLPVGGEAADRLRALDPAALQAHYQESLSELLAAAAARSPLVVVIEDVHWADPASTDLVSLLLPVVHQARVLVVVTSRPDRDTPGWGLVTAARDLFGEALAEITLEPLSVEDSRELISNLLEIESLPERLRELILQQTEGNPFFLEEVIRALIDQGAIVRHNGRWLARSGPEARASESDMDEPAEVEIPDTVHGLLLARMDRLPEGPRRTLRIASVIGRMFPVDILEAVADEDGAALRSALAALERHGLVELAAAAPTVEYAFRHALVQEAAYETLLKHERRRLHGDVAAALERLRPERQDELAGVLAHHYELAGDLEQAIEHLLRAGGRALARWANVEAAAHYATARRIAAEHPDMLEASVHEALLVRLARVLATLGRPEEATRAAEEARASALERGDDRSLFDALETLATVRHRGASSPSEAVPHARAALEVAERLADDAKLVRARVAVANPAVSLGHLDEAMTHYQSALDLASRTGHDLGAFPLARIGLIHHLRAQERHALDWCERAETVALEQPDEETLLMSRWIRALSLAALGRYAQAWGMLDSIAGIGKGEEVFWHVRVPNTYGHILADLCLHDRALERDVESVEAARASASRPVREAELQSLVNVAADRLALGDLAGARAAAAAVREQASEVEYSRYRYLSRLEAVDAEVTLAEGDAEASLSAAERCLEMAADHGQPRYEVRGRLAQGRALHALGATQEGRRQVRAAAGLADRLGFPGLSWRAWWTAYELGGTEADLRHAQESVRQVAAGAGELAGAFLAAVPVPP